jgi:hypothetical protein
MIRNLFLLLLTVVAMMVVQPIQGQDTLRANQLLDILDKSNSNKGARDNPKKTGEYVEPKENEVSAPENSSTFFGQFKPLVEQALFSNLLILEQQYIVTDSQGDAIEIAEDSGVPVLGVGLVIGNKILSALSTVRPWQEDARLAQLEDWKNPRINNLRYRQLEEGARWGQPKTYAIDSTKGAFSLYEGLPFNSRLQAVAGDEVSEGILMLIGYDKGADPADAAWYTDFLSVTPDWDKEGAAKLKVPELGKVYVGGFFLYPEITPGAVSFRVAGVLEMSGSDTTLKAVTEPKELNNNTDAFKKSPRSKKKGKKKKKRRRRRRRG